MKNIKKVLTLILTIGILMPIGVNAVNEDTIISIGADLNETQKTQVLSELGYEESMSVIEVTNQEEHNYLGGIVPDAKIGNSALSCARIDFLQNNGLRVDVSNNINYITEDIYYNALSTAGVTDAYVQVTAPMSVTGTGALTGILKAYEVSQGDEIDESVKQVATEEMITTAELAESIETEQVLQLIDTIKLNLEQNAPQTEEEARQLVINVSNELDITLKEDQVDKLTDLVLKMKDINIDWDLVKDNITKNKKNVEEFLSSEKGSTFIESVKNIFNQIIEWISSFFN